MITLHDPVDGVTLGLQLLVEPVLHQLPASVQELAVHVDRLVEGVPPRLVQEAHEREVPPWCRHPAEPGRGGRAHGVEQGTLVVAVDPAHVDPGVSRLDGREDEIRHFLKLGVSKSSIAKITGVTRPTLYNFIATRGLKAGA